MCDPNAVANKIQGVNAHVLINVGDYARNHNPPKPQNHRGEYYSSFCSRRGQETALNTLLLMQARGQVIAGSLGVSAIQKTKREWFVCQTALPCGQKLKQPSLQALVWLGLTHPAARRALCTQRPCQWNFSRNGTQGGSSAPKIWAEFLLLANSRSHFYFS